MTPPTILIFGIAATRHVGRQWSGALGHLRVYAENGSPDLWVVSLAYEDWLPIAVGHGPTLEEAEASCERRLRLRAENARAVVEVVKRSKEAA